MKGLVQDIEALAVENAGFRRIFSTALRAGFAVLVPAGTRHNIVNAGADHQTRQDAEADKEHFDGKTTE